ncbi:MAG: DNA-directed DNA polymerase II small subunit [Candidatus Woesearchaeota archaeon]
MDFSAKKKEIIVYFSSNQSLFSPEYLDLLTNENICQEAYQFVVAKKPIHQLEDFFQTKSKELSNKQSASMSSQNQNTPNASSSDNISSTKSTFALQTYLDRIKIIQDYDLIPHKWEVSDFVGYFATRYRQIEQLLRQRTELSNIISISPLKSKKDREQVAIIAIVQKKETTKNGNIIFTVEDQTGDIKVLVNKNNQELFQLAQDIVNDEIIGIIGMNGDNILFANNIIQPNVGLDKEFKKQEEEEYVVFLSDLHVGSKDYLEGEFNKFLSWINGETGTEKQRHIASKVRYIFIAGDIVEGIGIYPSQEEELSITDIFEQYNVAASYIKKIPKNIPIIICAGNHDAVRLSEPQPKLSKLYAKPFYEMENVVLVSNPSYISIGQTDDFIGFDVLMYHGYSFDYYAANVDSIRQNGGYDRADLIMKFMLQRRHLAPTYTSTLFIPEKSHDALVIDLVPDFFITGHIHKTAVSTYRNITTICGSCWQATTSFQEKVGHHPEPARVPVVNLKTRKVTILNFES